METMSAVISLDERERASSGSHHRRISAGNAMTEETFHTPTTETFLTPTGSTFAPGISTSEVPGVVGLAPPLPVNGLVTEQVVPVAPVAPVAATVVPVAETPSAVTVGQDYAGIHAGERTDLGESGVPGAGSGSRRRRDRHPDDLASVDSDASSSGDGDESTDYDSEYDAHHEEGVVTEEFIRWIEHLRRESLVHVTGTVQRPNNSTGRIKEASPALSGIELKIEKCFVIGRVTEHAPFQFNEIEGHHVATEEEKKTGAHKQKEQEDGGLGKISLRQELANRTFDLRVSLCDSSILSC